MRHHRIAVIPGDGVGKEVVPAALEVLDIAGRDFSFSLETTEIPYGSDYYHKHGQMMPDGGLRRLAAFDAIFLGAIGNPNLVPDHVSLEGLLLRIRRGFRYSVNVRPHRVLAGVESPLRRSAFDILCIRENTEGEYSGAGGRVHEGTEDEVVVETAIFSRRGCERVMCYAFDQASNRGKRIASATKSNALSHGMVFWDEVFKTVSLDYPDVETTKYHIDALCARFITHPETLDVVVAPNLLGDILTDIGAAIQGGLGFAPSANIDPTRTYPSLFEPVHGSAPDIAGKGIANPIAAIWAGALMLEFLGERQASEAIMSAIELVTTTAHIRTPDMGGRATTDEMGTAIASALAASFLEPSRTRAPADSRSHEAAGKTTSAKAQRSPSK